ncbi:unnamed protein product [Zymoseptoria tritici ST99CH_1E4]|uniref:Helicase C-terminal domain-containing protein n=1 Tax=Zymoseptoria tritici ST99CH_1E4 TaxID=1276532 RepID=A0A2H1GNG0_ZYMTR|nr:unnamed protein product [Zymoseptoria tritici ST99CH_1E4]
MASSPQAPQLQSEGVSHRVRVLSEAFRRRPELDVVQYISLFPTATTITSFLEKGECLVDSRPPVREDDDDEPEPADSEPDDDASSDYVGEDAEPKDEKPMTEDKLVELLRSFNAYIVQKHNAPPLPVPDGMLIQPYPKQLRFAGVSKFAATGPFKGVLLADNMGGGKTVSLLLGIKAVMEQGSGPSVYVTVAACTGQVMRQIKSFFGLSIKALLLNERSIPPQRIFDYDVVVMSYQFLVAEYQADQRFLLQMAKLNDRHEDLDRKLLKLSVNDVQERQEILSKKRDPTAHPRRPHACLLSEMFMQPGVGKLGPKLVLDEMQNIKNPHSTTFRACKELAQQFHAVDMASGTPMDNSWLDSFAIFAVLRGLKISSQHMMRIYFTAFKSASQTETPEHKFHPRSQKYINRLQQSMDAMCMRRPDANSGLQVTKTTLEWTPSTDDLLTSNEHFQTYKKAVHAGKDSSGTKPKAIGGPKYRRKATVSGTDSNAWKSLQQAGQTLCHKRLLEIYHLVANAQTKQRKGLGEKADELDTNEAVKELEEFLASMEVDEEYRSRKVDCILTRLRRFRDEFPDDAMLLFDDNIYFLDILAIAFKKQKTPIVFEFCTGRIGAVQRDQNLAKFSKVKGFRVLLCTPGAASVGLDLQWANHVFRTGPWWKRTYEKQALGRVLRDGQKKPTYEWEMKAVGSEVEAHRMKVRKQKNGIIKKILPAIERRDSDQLSDGQIIRDIR